MENLRRSIGGVFWAKAELKNHKITRHQWGQKRWMKLDYITYSGGFNHACEHTTYIYMHTYVCLLMYLLFNFICIYIYNMHTGYWLVCKLCYHHHSYQEWWSQLNKFFFGVKNLQTKCGGCQGFKGILLPFLAKSCMNILTDGTSFRAIPKTRTLRVLIPLFQVVCFRRNGWFFMKI